MNRYVLFLFGALPALMTSAQPPLSLGTAIELALENDIRLLPGKTELKITRLQQDNLAVWEDPEFRFEPSVDSKENYFDSAIRLYLPHPWQLQADSMERASQTAVSTAELQMGRIQTATEIFQLYREFQCLENELALANRLVEIKQQRAALAAQQVDAGVRTSADALLLRWELRDTQRETRTLRRDMSLLKEQLAERTAQPLDTLNLEPLPEPENSRAIDPETAVQSALELRPDLHLLHAQLQQAQSEVQQANAERIPWFSHVQAGYDESSEDWHVQAAISLPVFSLTGSKKRQALAVKSLWQASIDASQDAVSRQVKDAILTLNNAIEEWQMQHQELQELAGETQKEIDALREYASGDPDKWMKLQERILQAKRRLLDVRREVHAAHANYLLITGQTFIRNESTDRF